MTDTPEDLMPDDEVWLDAAGDRYLDPTVYGQIDGLTLYKYTRAQEPRATFPSVRSVKVTRENGDIEYHDVEILGDASAREDEAVDLAVPTSPASLHEAIAWINYQTINGYDICTDREFNCGMLDIVIQAAQEAERLNRLCGSLDDALSIKQLENTALKSRIKELEAQRPIIGSNIDAFVCGGPITEE